jgi:hypothetical protein
MELDVSKKDWMLILSLEVIAIDENLINPSRWLKLQ